MYDIHTCLSNYVDGKCKIGVTTNIRLAHNSIGELSPTWHENLKKVNDEFGKYYPIEVGTKLKK